MSKFKHMLATGFMILALAGCGSESDDASENTDNTGITRVEKSFTVSLAKIEVARISDGVPVTLESSDIQSGGTVTISQ